MKMTQQIRSQVNKLDTECDQLNELISDTYMENSDIEFPQELQDAINEMQQAITEWQEQEGLI